MRQRDITKIPFKIKMKIDGVDTYLTPSHLTKLIAKLGDSEKQYPGDIYFDTDKWYLPLNEKDNNVGNEVIQAKIYFNSGDALSSETKTVYIGESIIGGK